MKKRYDILHVIILVLFLVIAGFIDNTLVKGILLLLFSGILIYNALIKLKNSKEDKFKEKFFFGMLLFIDTIIALGAVFVIISAVKA